jgi:acetylornithine deacetylase
MQVSELDPIALTRELVRIPSPTGREGAVGEFLAGMLERADYRVVRQTVTPGRANVYAVLDPPVVVFTTHLDVVPPDLPVKEDEAYLWGRGSCDAKGLAAAMIAAAARLRARGERRIGLLFLVGEEDGSDGARRAAALEPKGRFIINGEPTENRLSIGQKGSLRVTLTATGRAAHSAYPAEGQSAVDALLETIGRIRAIALPIHPLLGPSTLNIGRLEGGVAPNVIAPWARADLLFRTVTQTGPLRDAIRHAADPIVEVDFPVEIPSLTAPEVPGWECTTVSFTSDLPFLSSWGEGYQLGPGSIRVAHTAEERIAKTELLEGVERYAILAGQLLVRGNG